MLATLFQLYSFDAMLLVDSLVKRQGPFSWKSPIKLLQPGPPLSQRAKGAMVGSLRLSKNHQNSA